jgi:hypothetical protein
LNGIFQDDSVEALFYRALFTERAQQWAEVVGELSHRADNGDVSAAIAIEKLYSTKVPYSIDRHAWELASKQLGKKASISATAKLAQVLKDDLKEKHEKFGDQSKNQINQLEWGEE